MFTTSTAFLQPNAQQIEQREKRVEQKYITQQFRQFCTHGINAGDCVACGSSE